MDIPLVLEFLGLNHLSWGANAQTGKTYAEFVSTWPPGNPAPPTEAEMDTAWQSLLNANGGITPGTPDYVTMQLLAVSLSNVRRLSQSLSSSVVALQDVGNLRFQVAPNRHYLFEFHGAWTTALNGTGLRLAVNCPAGHLAFGVQGFIWESATTHRAGVTGTPDQALVAQSGLAGTNLPFSVRGNVSTGSQGGWLSLRGASEVAGSQVTIQANSYGILLGAA